MSDYSQKILIARLNRYLKSTASDVKLQKEGYCHGLTLLWLYKMANAQENWFYQTINKIVNLPETVIGLDHDIERFIQHIEWLQNPNKYVNAINQLDIDKTLEFPKKDSLSYLFTVDQLQQALTSTIQQQQMICLSGINHTVGVFSKGDNEYHFFDANYPDDHVRIVHSIAELQALVIPALYGDAKIDRYPLEINILPVNNVANVTDTLYPIFEKDTELDHPGLLRMTNLYLACENGDAVEADFLLSQGANPNQRGYRGITPLSVASECGYLEVAKVLLQHQANVNQLDALGLNPLFWAISRAHDDVVKLLLDHGANPLHKIRNFQTPLHYALSQENWQHVGVMLGYLQDAKQIPLKDKLLLKNHRTEIMQNMPVAARNHAAALLGNLFTNEQHGFFKPRHRIVLQRSLSFTLNSPR